MWATYLLRALPRCTVLLSGYFCFYKQQLQCPFMQMLSVLPDVPKSSHRTLRCREGCLGGLTTQHGPCTCCLAALLQHCAARPARSVLALPVA